MKKHHSILQIFANFNQNVPRILASVLVYARFNALFALAGNFLINGASTGTNIGALIGCSICFNILGKLLYLTYETSQSKMNFSKKEADGFALFKATLSKMFTLSLVYLYIILAVYFSFVNATQIASSSSLAVPFVVAFFLDILIFDTIMAFVTSKCRKQEE